MVGGGRLALDEGTTGTYRGRGGRFHRPAPGGGWGYVEGSVRGEEGGVRRLIRRRGGQRGVGGSRGGVGSWCSAALPESSVGWWGGCRGGGGSVEGGGEREGGRSAARQGGGSGQVERVCGVRSGASRRDGAFLIGALGEPATHHFTARSTRPPRPLPRDFSRDIDSAGAVWGGGSGGEEGWRRDPEVRGILEDGGGVGASGGGGQGVYARTCRRRRRGQGRSSSARLDGHRPGAAAQVSYVIYANEHLSSRTRRRSRGSAARDRSLSRHGLPLEGEGRLGVRRSHDAAEYDLALIDVRQSGT